MNRIPEYAGLKQLAVSIAVASAALALAVPAYGAEQETETIEVKGETYRNTATKTSLRPEETPQGISIISAEEIAQQAADSVTQALRFTPGVNTEVRGGGVTMYDTFNIRGFDVDRSYYDGLVLSPLNGWNLQPQIDPVAIEQLEVFKGPTSVLYGTMPPGGMVNIIAKAPSSVSSTEVNLATGTGLLRQGSVDTTGQVGDSDFNYRLIAKGSYKEGQVDTTEEESYLIAPSVDWNVSDKTLINVNAYYQNDPSMGMNSALPASGMIYDNANGSTDSSTYAGDANWDEFDRQVLMLGYKISHELSKNWSFLQNARYTDGALAQQNTYHQSGVFDESTGELARNIYSTDEELSSIAIDNQLSGLITTGPITHSLLAGLDYQSTSGVSDYSEYYTTDASFYGFNIFDADNYLLDTDTVVESYVAVDDVEVEQLGVYFQDQLRLGSLVVIAGGRYDDYQSSSYFEDFTYDVVYESDADHQAFSYRVGSLYEFANGLSPFASYATSFEPAAGTDSDGNAYEPELGQQLEAGIKYAPYAGNVEFTGSAFHITKTDALLPDPSNVYAPYLQVGELVSQGAELDAKIALTPSLNLAASYTYINMEITEDDDNGYEGKQPIWVPEHSASLWANYFVDGGILAGTRIGGGVRYVGEMQIDAANTGTVPDYTLFDLSLGYNLGSVIPKVEDATVSVVVNNLLDEEYYSCYDSENCWYGAERNITANLNIKF
ncbi:TonB-dependent siderophore receptor [Reinekea thalattae]|uniref:TonB-dependent siderophore receptor n=1 Tax=Reinekea thalattae TaxID=2593301 RepID=A0A5C8Z8Y3_9GAMM|nr:TonB-dependent siderophore receptor [Reinekea thalattae]TXR54402.1 TonB-dependent siderophore receptor [Reinekea thalattae]